MAQTVSSTTTPYCDSSELAARFDVRVLCQLASDDETPIDPIDMPDDPRITTALLGASGEVEAAISEGARYTPEDLALLAATACGARAIFFDLVCGLALARLFRARPDFYGPKPALVQEAIDNLEKLRRGLWVFGFVESRKAGNVASTYGPIPGSKEDLLKITTRGSRLFGPPRPDQILRD